MSLRERTSQKVSGGEWQAVCLGCDWCDEGETRIPHFRAARKHAAETGHVIRVITEWEWRITRKEEP